MFSVKFVAIAVALFVQAALGQQQSANDYCWQCSQRRNHKDAYPDPAGDCHSFYKCQYINETYAIGTKLTCPSGTFWNDLILSCMPEGPTPCSDVCQDFNVAAKGCYAKTGNCATYFVCSNYASYGFCCPNPLTFDETTCTCVNDQNACTDACDLPPPPPPTTENPPQNFGTICIDSFGSRLQATSDLTTFQLLDDLDVAHTLPCATGTTFDTANCRCEGVVIPETQPPNRQCNHYLPLDTNFNDYATSKAVVDAIDPVQIVNDIFAQGTGSLLAQGGHLEIPYSKSWDVSNQATVCLFFRCSTSPCQGGLFSNNKDAAMSEYNTILSAQADGTVQLQINLLTGPVSASFPINSALNTPSGFTQICFTLNGTDSAIYVNNVLLFSSPSKAVVAPAHCPVAIGSDQTWGDFNGYIDEVLTCPFGLTADEVNAHWNGPAALAKAGLIPS